MQNSESHRVSYGNTRLSESHAVVGDASEEGHNVEDDAEMKDGGAEEDDDARGVFPDECITAWMIRFPCGHMEDTLVVGQSVAAP